MNIIWTSSERARTERSTEDTQCRLSDTQLSHTKESLGTVEARNLKVLFLSLNDTSWNFSPAYEKLWYVYCRIFLILF